MPKANTTKEARVATLAWRSPTTDDFFEAGTEHLNELYAEGWRVVASMNRSNDLVVFLEREIA